MQVKYNSSKDATVLLLGCLYLLGTSLQAQFGGDGLEQAKPPHSLHPFGKLETRSVSVTDTPGDETKMIILTNRTTQEWFSPTSSRRNFIVYRKTQTLTSGTMATKNGKPVETSLKVNKQSITQETCYRRADGRYFWIEQSSGPARQGNNRSDAPPEMPDYVGRTSEKRQAQITIPTPDGPIERQGLVQVTSTSTRSVEVRNDSKQPIRLALTLPYTDRHVPSPPGLVGPALWVPQQGVWSSQPLTIPVGASTPLDMALPQGWLAGKFLPESITILSGGGAGGGPGQPGM